MCTECRAKEVKETKERVERERKEWQKNNLSNINENGNEHSHEQAEVVVEEKSKRTLEQRKRRHE